MSKRERNGVVQTDKGIFKIRKNGCMKIVIDPGKKTQEIIRVTPPKRLIE